MAKARNQGKPFAVVRKSDDTFVTMQQAKNKGDLEGKYPPSEFDLFNMTGNNDVPQKEGAFNSDLTVDPSTREWKWKVTDEEIASRAKSKRTDFIKSRIVRLRTYLDKATALGPDFEDEAARLREQIEEAESQLH